MILTWRVGLAYKCFMDIARLATSAGRAAVLWRTTAGQSTQNLMGAAQAAALPLALAVVAIWPGGWLIDPSSGSVSPGGRSGKATEPGREQTAASRPTLSRQDQDRCAINVPSAGVSNGIS